MIIEKSLAQKKLEEYFGEDDRSKYVRFLPDEGKVILDAEFSKEELLKIVEAMEE